MFDRREVTVQVGVNRIVQRHPGVGIQARRNIHGQGGLLGLVDLPDQVDPSGSERADSTQCRKAVDDQGGLLIQHGPDRLGGGVGVRDPEGLHFPSRQIFGGVTGVVAIVTFTGEHHDEFTGRVSCSACRRSPGPPGASRHLRSGRRPR